MAEPFIGEIRQVTFNFAPAGWLPCDGRLVSIGENDALYALIGTTYGGDGISNFALPDLRGRVSIHQGQSGGGNYTPGQMGGASSVTLTTSQMASHSHVVRANNGLGTVSVPTVSSTWAQVTPDGTSANSAYSSPPGTTNLSSTAVVPVGSGNAVDIRQPYVVVNFMIATSGIFPSQQ